MRCLFLSPFVPFPPEDGGRIRIHALLTGLARSHEVHVLALGEPTGATRDAAAALRAQGIPTEVVEHRRGVVRAVVRGVVRGTSSYAERYASAAFRARLAEHLARGRYDVVQCEFPYLARYHRPGGPTWVLELHNVAARLSESLAALGTGPAGAAYRLYARREATCRRREEEAACRAAHHILTVSEADRQRLLEIAPTLPVTVAPNGVDLEHFAPAAVPDRLNPPAATDHRGSGVIADPNTPVADSGHPASSAAAGAVRPEAVFIGKMDYRPNVDGVLWFCREVLPRVRSEVPDFCFTIVGAQPTPEITALDGTDGVRVTGRVPDTRPYLHEAAIAVVPLRAGSGTRLKVLEAFAMGRAVVSTSIGCEGIDAEPGRHLVTADDGSDFAGAVVRLLRGPDERARLGAQARALVEARYGWPTTVEIVERVLESVVSRAGGGRA